MIISQFVISEGAWNCGRKSGVSKVNCEKNRVNHRTRVPFACRTQYTVYVIAQQTMIQSE